MNQEQTLSKLTNYDLFRVTQPYPTLKKTRKKHNMDSQSPSEYKN